MTNLGGLCELVGGQLFGDPATMITDAASVMRAGEDQITFITSEKYLEQFLSSNATAAIISTGLHTDKKPTIVVDDVEAAFALVVQQFRNSVERPKVGISPQAIVSPSAKIADDVDIYPGAVIGDDVEIGCGSVVMPNVTILESCIIGANVQIFPGCVLYENTQLGDRCILHSGVVLGAFGFGYKSNSAGHKLTAQLGNVVIENDVEIGANTTIDRGTYESTFIGEGTKIDDQVMVGHNCRLGKHNLLCAQVGIAGSCTTGDFVVMAGQVGIGDHVDIGNNVTLLAKAGIMKDIEDGAILGGSPAIPVRRYLQVEAIRSKLPEMRKQLKQLAKELDRIQQLPEESVKSREAA